MKPLRSLTVAACLLAGVALQTKAAPIEIYVPSNLLWADTGINLSGGSMVSITASGSWDAGWGSWCGPDGLDSDLLPSDLFYSSARHAALIAYVGPDPYQGHWGDATFFPQASGYWDIGSASQFASGVSGELWLGFNDDAVTKGASDNQGSVTAQVTVVPEPNSLMLLFFGSMALARVLSSQLRACKSSF